MFIIKHVGDFSKTERFFNRMLGRGYLNDLSQYGEEGVTALQNATPKDTGETASGWTYEIEHSNGKTIIGWKNKNQNKGVIIAVILQYGHGTNHGGWVQGTDYINPAIRPIFDKISEKAWKEVRRR